MTGKISEDPDRVVTGGEKLAASFAGANYGVLAASFATYLASLAQTLTNKAIDATTNTISNIQLSMFAPSVIDTDPALSANSDNRLATQKAVKAAIAAGGGGGTGNVVGPASAVDSNFTQFSGTTGKLVKDGGLAFDIDGALAANSDARIASQKAIRTLLASAISGLVTIGNVREKLSANRSYYVATTGSDTLNNGLTVGAPFATIQKAIDTACALDLSIYAVTINVAAGTYTPANTLKRYLGVGPISIVGAGNTTIINVTGDNGFFGADAGSWVINTLRILGSYGLFVTGVTSLSCTGVEFGACTFAHIRASSGAAVRMFAYTIAGSSANHYLAEYAARILCINVTVTLTGTPAFSTAFAQCTKHGLMDLELANFSGAAGAGTRYIVTTLGLINTVGLTLPGSVNGVPATGGVYT